MKFFFITLILYIFMILLNSRVKIVTYFEKGIKIGSMEEVDLKELFVYFIKRISIIIVMIILCVITGVVYTKFIKVPLYEGKTTIILVNKSLDNNTNSTITQSDVILNQKLVSTYSQIVKSKKILKQVISNLSLNYSYQELYNHVSVSNVSDTEIIKIIVSDENPELAASIANNVAEVFKTEVSEIYHLENVTIIDKAEVSKDPYNIKVVKTAGICFIGGFAISIMLLFVLYYFDTSIKSSEEVEKKLGIAVIGTIPHAGRRVK